MRRSLRWLGALALVLLVVVTPVGAMAAPGEAAPAAATCTYYRVRAGDTMYGIAARFGVDPWAIARANHITNINRIYVGQVLCIPTGGGTPPPPPAHCPIHYTVQRGDTLTKIAARYGVTVSAIANANHITNVNRIYVGQHLVIPCRGTPPGPPPPGPPPPRGPWAGKYFNNTDLTGSPVLTRNDPAINFNWGFGSPNPQVVTADFFSAHWSRTANFSAGLYRFFARSDDGVRVWVDGQIIIDEWRIQAAAGFYHDLVLNAGNHTIVVEYYEDTGRAEVYVWWEKR